MSSKTVPMGWSPERLRALLAKFRKKKILVVGDIGVDRYTIGSVDRISPEAPVPIVLVQEEKLKLGLAANVADNIQTLGGLPLLLGVVGKDRAAEDFRKLLKNARIDSSHLVVDPSRRTVLKERVVSDRQQLVRIDYESPHGISEVTEEKVLKKFQQLLTQADAVIVEDYAKGTLGPQLMKSFFSYAKKAKKLIAVDPNLKTPAHYYLGASILTPNTREAEFLSGMIIRDESSLKAAGFKILKLTSAQFVVVTRGKDGMALFSKGSSHVRWIPTYAREVYDVSGAGDTVISVMVLSLVVGATIDEASLLGNLAAGVEVGKRGTATVSPDEVQVAINSLEAAI